MDHPDFTSVERGGERWGENIVAEGGKTTRFGKEAIQRTSRQNRNKEDV